MQLLGTYKIRNNATKMLEGHVIRSLKAARKKRDAANVKAVTKALRKEHGGELDDEGFLSPLLFAHLRNPNHWPYCLARMV